MNLIELNDIIMYKEKKLYDMPNITRDDIEAFKEVLNISASAKEVFYATEDSADFINIVKDVKKIMKPAQANEIFYILRNGSYIEGVPSKLIFVINKIIKEMDNTRYINVAMNRCVPLIAPYADCEYSTANGIANTLDIIQAILGYPVKLLTSSVRKVKTDKVYEIFVEGVDRVALLPYDIGSKLNIKDCESVRFDKAKGLVLNGIPLRIIGERMGVVFDDFDLREVI